MLHLELQPRMRAIFGLALCLLVFGTLPLMADITGSILGTVVDSSGGVVPGVAVRATNQDTNMVREVRSNSAGQYRLMSLPVGRYKLDVSASGFQSFRVTDIVLTVDEQRQVDAILQVGEINSKVEVVANTAQVETTSTQLGDVIEQKKLLSLPLNGRSFIDLLGLQAGVAPASTGSAGSSLAVSGNLSSGQVSVNGQRETANAFLVNGGDVNESRTMGAAVIPNLDSVAEFRLITNSFDAEYGRFSGSVMNAVTKSGENAIHGAGFEFLRNNDMDARGFFDPTRAALKRNQFGYAVGGPFLKNKLFWFTDYQGTREIQGASSGMVLVPTEAERGGQFSASDFSVGGQAQVVNGNYWAQTLSQRLGYGVNSGEPYYYDGCSDPSLCVFPNGKIPTGGFSKVAVNMMKYIPSANIGANHYASAAANGRVNDDKAGQKVDLLTQKHGTWSFYYFFDDSTNFSPQSTSFPGFFATTPTRAQQVVASNTWTFGPTAVNEFRASYHRMASVQGEPGGEQASLSDLGFATGANTLGINFSGTGGFQYVPYVQLTDFNFGSSVSTTGQYNNTYHVSDGFAKVSNKHNLKFGGEFRYLQINERNLWAPAGQFAFDGSETGSSFVDFLLGAPASYTQASTQMLDSRTRYGGAYAQDSIRLKPNLTLNLGLRWEVSMPWYDTQNRIETLIPGEQSVVYPNAPTGYVFPGDPGVPRTLAPTDYLNFAPRAGLAWSPSAHNGILHTLFGDPGKSSIRAAWGMYYTAVEDMTMFWEVGDPPYGLYWTSYAPTMFDQPFLTRSTGQSQGQHFPFIFPTPGDKNVDFSSYLPLSYTPGYWYKNHQPYSEHYNFTFQRALSSSMALTLAFVGNQSHRLLTSIDSNPGNPALCQSLTGSGVMAGTQECGEYGENTIYTRPNGTLVYGTRAPFGNDFGTNAYMKTTANSNYNSFQATLERKAKNMTFLAAYTWAKSIDNSSGFYSYTNFSNYGLSRSLSAFDIAHNFVASYVYALPFDTLFQHAPRRLTTGWTLSGITRFATGFPVGLGQSGDRSLTGNQGGVELPDLIGPVQFEDPKKPGNRYFDTGAFQVSAIGMFGDANRAFFHGPGFENFDLSMAKTTQINERVGLLIRAEFFNTFNHTQFGNPNGNISSDNFGIVTQARSPRIGQVSAKVLW